MNNEIIGLRNTKLLYGNGSAIEYFVGDGFLFAQKVPKNLPTITSISATSFRPTAMDAKIPIYEMTLSNGKRVTLPMHDFMALY